MIKKRKSNIIDMPAILEDMDPGSGVDFSLSDTLPNSKLKATYFASNKVSPLEIGLDNMKRIIKVSYSSAAYDNQQLLHFLFKKSKG